MTNSTTPCPCGSQQDFEQCCRPLLMGEKLATTAQALMRSRYSAFVTGNVDHLINTLHPAKRQPQDEALLTETLKNTRWLGLKIGTLEQGLEGDERGSVEFVATWAEAGESGFLHERSRFLKQDGHWYYVDGTLYNTDGKTIDKPGRSDPCG